MYQEIERGLKLLLPHLQTPDDAHPADSYKDALVLFREKKTLGPLLQSLKQRIEVDQREAFETYLSTIVEHRNELIHPPPPTRPRLADVDDCERELLTLKARYTFALPLRSIVRELHQAFVAILDDQLPTSSSSGLP